MGVSKTWQHCKRSSEHLNCTQFDQLILRKIVKIVATKCHLLRLKCTKLNFGWGSAQTPLGELTALPRPPSQISGVSFQAEGAEGKKVEEELDKSPKWLSQKLGSTANAAVNS